MAATSAQEDSNIQRLLEAEKIAQGIVAEARAKRAEKMKLAKQEAEREVAAFRAELEKDFENKAAASSSLSDTTFQDLDKQTNDSIQHITSGLPTKKKEAVNMLVNYVVNVELSNN